MMLGRASTFSSFDPGHSSCRDQQSSKVAEVSGGPDPPFGVHFTKGQNYTICLLSAPNLHVSSSTL